MGPSASSFSSNSGNSSRHGAHHDAQKFTTSGLAAVRGQVERRAVERRAHDRRRRLPDPRHGRVAAARGDERGRQHEADDDRGPEGRASTDRGGPTAAERSPSCSDGSCTRTCSRRPGAPGRRRHDGLGPVTISPWNIGAAASSLIATSWGTRVLVVERERERGVGGRRDVRRSMNVMLAAMIVTSAAGTCRGRGRRRRRTAAAAGLAARRGLRAGLRSSAAARSRTRGRRDQHGERRRTSPSASAARRPRRGGRCGRRCSTATYSLRASEQPAERVMTIATEADEDQPAADDEPGHEDGHRDRDEQRPERGRRDVDARRAACPAGAGSMPTTTGCAARCAGMRVVVAQGLAAPVEEREDEDDAADERARCPPATSPNTSRNMPTPPRNGANDGPGMWMPGGATGGRRRLPRRVGPAVAEPVDRSRRGTGRPGSAGPPGSARSGRPSPG